MTSSGLRCPPTFSTQRNLDRPTLGPFVEDYHFLLSRGRYFMEHQRFIADVAHELDPVTGLYWYDTVLIIIPRQNGKTTYIEAKLTRSAEAGKFRQLIYAAQNADKAREKIVDELYDQRLARHPYFAGRCRARRSNGSAHVRFLNTGSKIFVVPSNDSAADGKTVDDGVLDEAFVYSDLSIISSVQPTMATRPDPQLTLISTVGDGDDGLLQHYEDIGMAAINDPHSRIAIFIWQAGPNDDLDRPEVWARIMPALGTTITVERIASYRRSMPTAQFDRSFGNRRPTISELAGVDLEAWSAAARPDDVALPIRPPFVAGFQVHPDRKFSSIGVVGHLVDDPSGAELGMVVDRRKGTGWIADELQSLQTRGCVEFAADRAAGAGGPIDAAAGRGIIVTEVTGAAVSSACGTLVDELDEHTLAHQDQPKLTAAAQGSRRRPLGGGFCWDQRNADVDLSPLQSVSLAVSQYRKQFPNGYTPERIR